MKGSTVALIGMGVVAVGAGVYLFMNRDGGQMMVAGPGVAAQPVNTANIQQPGLAYPYQPVQYARNQNTSEPWYNGSKGGMQTSILGPDTSFAYLQQYATGGAEIATSLSSIWDTFGVSDFFSSDPTMEFGDEAVVSDSWGSFDWGSVG